MGAEQAAERLRLGLAQLRELGRHVGDRAVVLAELLPPASTVRAGPWAPDGTGPLAGAPIAEAA